MTQVLELQFATTDGKTTTLSIDAPKPNITVTEIQQAMATIMAKNVLLGKVVLCQPSRELVLWIVK